MFLLNQCCFSIVQALLCSFAEISALPVTDSANHHLKISGNAIPIFDYISTEQSQMDTIEASSLSSSSVKLSSTSATTHAIIESLIETENENPLITSKSQHVKQILGPDSQNHEHMSNRGEQAFIGVIGVVKLLAKTLLAARYF